MIRYLTHRGRSGYRFSHRADVWRDCTVCRLRALVMRTLTALAAVGVGLAVWLL